jgi:hypothetical protein
MSREPLPNRRLAETFDFEISGLRYTCTVGHYPDGRLAEVFVQNHKRGNASDVAARDAGILLSFCLQYGCPVEDISRALSRNSDGSASGVMAALLDAIVEHA